MNIKTSRNKLPEAWEKLDANKYSEMKEQQIKHSD